jgi:hypothetical protein
MKILPLSAGLPELMRAISMLSPGSLNTFSAGKYEETDHIEPHDDRLPCTLQGYLAHEKQPPTP